MSKKQTITAYKGFDRNLCCRGFQYEVGEEYEMDGSVECCQRGFHACESPLEVLDHYFLLDDASMARFCEVEQSGTLAGEQGSTKVASSKIKIKAELKFSDLVKLGIEWIKEKTLSAKLPETNNNGGYSAQIGSSGDYAKIGSSGYSAQIGSSGYSAQIGSSGDYAKIGSSGDYAKINSTGEDSVIMCAGHNSIVKAKKGSWITLTEWVKDEDKNRWVPKCVKTEQVDGERIKADTWYRLMNGEFVEYHNE